MDRSRHVEPPELAVAEADLPDGEIQMLTSNVGRLWDATSQMVTTLGVMQRIAQERQDLLDRAIADIAGAPSRGVPVKVKSDRVVSLAEAARVTGRNHDLLRRWCSEGRLPAVRVGRSWALPESALAYLASVPRRRRRHLGRHRLGRPAESA